MGLAITKLAVTAMPGVLATLGSNIFLTCRIYGPPLKPYLFLLADTKTAPIALSCQLVILPVVTNSNSCPLQKCPTRRVPIGSCGIVTVLREMRFHPVMLCKLQEATVTLFETRSFSGCIVAKEWQLWGDMFCIKVLSFVACYTKALLIKVALTCPTFQDCLRFSACLNWHCAWLNQHMTLADQGSKNILCKDPPQRFNVCNWT